MTIKAQIKELGRGKDGARDLSTADAHGLMQAIFNHEVSPMELGAVAIALRVKGESLSEMRGFMQAAQDLLQDISALAEKAPIVSIPSYNGARKLPNLVPLLACSLADAGAQVIVHGFEGEASRVSTLAVFKAMGLPVVTSEDRLLEVLKNAFEARLPCYVPLEVLHPPLAQLLRVRETLGLRNSGHSMVKLLNLVPKTPGRHLLVTSYTHPEYAVSMREYLCASHANALLMRGTEGEAVADARRAQAIEHVSGGAAGVVQEAQSGVLASLPVLPQAIDAVSTAHFTQRVLAGELPLPQPIAQQIICVQRAAAASAQAFEVRHAAI